VKRVVVIGGGVAGIAAATALAEAGLTVEIYEKRPLLGGRASSFIERETGERLDVCQHGTMRCCTNLADLLERLGVHDRIRYFDVIEFLDSAGKRSVIAGCGLPAPMHTSLSFLAFRSLGLRDKIAIARGMLAMVRAKPEPKYETLDIGTWYRQQKQTERAIRRFWEPVLVSACNENLSRISCAHAFKIFRDGFLLHPQAYHFGIPRVPLGTLYTEPTQDYLQKRGGSVHLRAIVERVHLEEGRLAGITLSNGRSVTADCFVSALPFDLLLKLLPTEATQGVPYFDNLRRIEFSPIIGVHLWFDRPIDCPHAVALLDRPTDWIFNKTLNFDLPSESGTYLSMVISADRELTARTNREVLEQVIADVHAALPQTRTAVILKSQVLKERKATFSPVPGVESLRPDQRSPIENLYVAGEWTNTGWPSTMESAARSGYLAAERLLEDMGRSERYLVADLPSTGLARLLDGHRAAPAGR
jgi:zeta-carotene desaturase